MPAITLFTLPPDRAVTEYRDYSKAVAKPEVNAMSSVLAFRNFPVRESYDGGAPPATLVVVIEIADVASFKRDNETPPGSAVAEDRATSCASYEVLLCDELA